MQFIFVVLVFVAVISTATAFLPSTPLARSGPRVGPVFENFGLVFAEDAAKNTPRQIFGEANYKNFVESYDPEALLVGGPKYNIIERVRELKLLSLTAESGLLDALEEKGLTLSALEKLLPLADDLGLLPLLVKNKEAVVGLAPLLIEPAPVLLPLTVSLLKTPGSTFSAIGLALIAAGAFEMYEDAALLGVPLVLFALPLVVLGSLLSNPISIPTPSALTAPSVPISAPQRPSSNRPTVAVRPRASTSVPVAASKGVKVLVAKPALAAPKAIDLTPKSVPNAAPKAVAIAPKASKSSPKAAAPTAAIAPRVAPRTAPKVEPKPASSPSATLNGRRKTVKIN